MPSLLRISCYGSVCAHSHTSRKSVRNCCDRLVGIASAQVCAYATTYATCCGSRFLCACAAAVWLYERFCQESILRFTRDWFTVRLCVVSVRLVEIEIRLHHSMLTGSHALDLRVCGLKVCKQIVLSMKCVTNFPFWLKIFGHLLAWGKLCSSWYDQIRWDLNFFCHILQLI